MVWAYFGKKKKKKKKKKTKKDSDLCYATFHGKPSSCVSGLKLGPLSTWDRCWVGRREVVAE